MGWWNNLWSSNTTSDPLGKLDPELKKFLERESPVKYHPVSTSTSEQQSQGTDTSKSVKSQISGSKDASLEQPEKPKVPPQSLFPDGRYAHLWKTYRPLAEIEAEVKSDNEKLMDILEGFKERQSAIAKIAVENCALEQVAWRECMTEGGIRAKTTMCRDEVRKFERCYNVQSRLLKTLGYLSDYQRAPEVDEEIQMHAYDLYQRMLEQEELIAQARKEGKPIPEFKPIAAIPPGLPADASKDPETYLATLHPAIKALLQDKLDRAKTPGEKVAVVEAWKADQKSSQELSGQVKELWEQQAREREERKREGKATLRDRLAGVFGAGGTATEKEKGAQQQEEKRQS